MEQSQNNHKQVISSNEFYKKVDIARPHYEYFDRLSTEESKRLALEEVSKKFKIINNQ